MADIRLQDYVARIKELIRSVRLDEAIAHCQHILRHYPKHIETYSLLGEACLEKQMYREAIEFFQRTLGADPENLMARVGLGVIYDEQGAFPEAIWQLERAFELVPGNSEVRRELLRLYGQYDGIDKSRLKLTRGALGRLYSRNGLYERAIGEFHAVLRQDPELPDIRVALAEALWREGRQLEAVEMCMELLDALPNCLKANLILGEIWLRGGNEESAEQRFNVARALDPENRVAQELMGSDSPLPPEDLFIPELDAIPDEFEFVPSAVPGAGVAAGAAVLAADIASVEEEPVPWGTDEELPEWLRDVGVTAEEPALELAPDEAVLEPPADEGLPAEDMPEWLREVMEEERGPSAAEPVPPEAQAFDDEPVVAGEPPELLQEAESPEPIEVGLAVVGLMDDEEEEPVGEDEQAEQIPEWLEELVGEAGPSVSEEPAPEKELAAPMAAESEASIPSIEEEPLPAEEAPDQAASEAPDGIPEWVGTLGVAAAAGVIAVSLTGDEEEAPQVGEAPDSVPERAEALDTTVVQETGAAPVVEAEEEPGELEQDLLTDEDLPDWLRDLGVAAVAEAAATSVDDVETELLSVQAVVEAEELVQPEEDVLAGETPDEAPDGAPEEVPDWLRALDDLDVEGVAGPVVAEVAEEPPPDEAPEEIPDWLRALDDLDVEDVAGPVVAEVAEEPPADEASDGIPDWLRALDRSEAEEGAASAVAEADEPPAVTEEVPLIDEIPDWLRDLDKVEVEEISASPVFGDAAQVDMEDVQEEAIPASLLALVAAGLLDEADLESAMAEMSDEDLEAQRAEDVPEWLSGLVEEEVPVAGEPFLQELPTPVLDLPVEEEPSVAEAVAQIVEPEPEAEVPIAESMAEIATPVLDLPVEEEPSVAEAVVEMVEPEPEVPVEEIVAEVVEPEPEAPVEEVVAEVVEPELEAPVEEVVAEIIEPEPEAPVEEVVAEIIEPELEVPVEEAVAKVVEPEPEAVASVEEAAPEVTEPETELVVEEAMLEVAEEIAAPARKDELLQQLKARPRDYASRLELARLYHDEQDWDAAIVNYEKLISARRFLPDIVADLEGLAEQDVEPARVYRMLGDAYMQQDQLDDALEMYRRARHSLTRR